MRGREGGSNGHVLMPSTQCYDDLPSKDLCMHMRDMLTSNVMIKSKVMYSATGYAEQYKGCMALERYKLHMQHGFKSM